MVIYWLFFVYWAEIVFRNFAFLRVEKAYQEGKMQPTLLLDIGHDWTSDPDVIAFAKEISEVPYKILSLWAFLLPSAAYYLGTPKPGYLVAYLSELAVYLSFGHQLRFLCYSSTTLPGSADHCLARDVETWLSDDGPSERVRHGIDFWIKMPKGGGNCGDLIFSGHMYLTMFLLRTSVTGTWQLFSGGGKWGKYMKPLQIPTTVLLISCACLQAFSTFASRNHYTVDVVLGVFVHWAIYDKVPKLIERFGPVPPEAKLKWLFVGLSPLLHFILRGLKPLFVGGKFGDEFAADVAASQGGDVR